MYRIFLIVGLLMVILLTGLSCFSPNLPASTGQEFTLPVGKTASIADENLSIKFVEVTADSRCPSDVVCVQAGEAKCQVLIKYLGSVSSVVLTQNGSMLSQQVFSNYVLNFKLEPYPVSTQKINPADYKLVITINKNASQ
jgi:hypothetical protein